MRAVTTVSALLVTLAPSCSSSSAKPVDAAGANDVRQTSDVGQLHDIALGRDIAPEVAADAAMVPPDNVMFPDAPEATCTGAAADCPFPPSACADPSCDGGACAGLPWVVYYDSPICLSGKCAYQKRYFECDVSSRCSSGGCRFNGTLAAPQ
jgi:hypothetical protein